MRYAGDTVTRSPRLPAKHMLPPLISGSWPIANDLMLGYTHVLWLEAWRRRRQLANTVWQSTVLQGFCGRWEGMHSYSSTVGYLTSHTDQMRRNVTTQVYRVLGRNAPYVWGSAFPPTLKAKVYGRHPLILLSNVHSDLRSHPKETPRLRNGT